MHMMSLLASESSEWLQFIFSICVWIEIELN